MLLSEWSTSIKNAHQLQLMVLNLGASYTLANFIDVNQAVSNPSDVWSINGSAGFIPIGEVGNAFSGISQWQRTDY